MPNIGRARPVSAPIENVLSERIDCPNPDGNWSLVFHTPREWHMGADGWQAKLFHRDREVTARHNDLLGIAGRKGFRFEPHFQPWSYDSKALALVTWDQKPIHLYEVAAKRDRNLSYQREFVDTAQWAPDADRLLITSATDGVLFNQAGEQRALVQWGIEEGQMRNTYWMKTGICFFLLARESARSRTKLNFYSGTDGTLMETHDLDPMDLVLYDWEKYGEMPRDRFCLEVVDPSIGSVGSMLDTWNSVHFEQASGTLFLAVLRPVSKPYREGGELLCKVEQRWVAVELTS